MPDRPVRPAAERKLSRRALARGAAWAMPIAVAAVAAPAHAVSAPRGCATLLWTSTTLSGTQGTSGVRTGTLPFGTSRITVTVRQNRTAGLPANYDGAGAGTSAPPTPGSGDFSVAAAGQQKASGAQTLSHQTNAYVVPTGSTASVLTLNQKSSAGAPPAAASETITFSFTDATGAVVRPASISFNVYDVTSQTSGLALNGGYYTDRITWSGATAAYGTAVGDPTTYTTRTSSTLQGAAPSSLKTGSYLPVTLTPTSATPGFVYADAVATGLLTKNFNQQYVGIGDLKVCF